MAMALLLAAFLVGCIYLSLFDMRLYRRRVTPFTVLAVPFAVIATLAIAFAFPLGFVAIEPGILTIWSAGLIAFWLGGLPFAMAWNRKHAQHVHGSHPPFDEGRFMRAALIVGWGCVAIIAIGVAGAIVSLGLGSVGTSAFARIFSSGLVGHANVIGSAVLLLLVGTTDSLRSKKTLLIVCLLAASVLYAVRSWVLIPLIGGCIYRISTGRLKVTLRMVLIVLVASFLIFSSKYILNWLATSPESLFAEENLLFLIRHFAAYVFAGCLGLSEALRVGLTNLPGINPAAMFAPILNVLNVFSGGLNEPIQIVNVNYLHTGIEFEELSNVFTLFGTAQYHLGTIGMLLYSLGLGAVCSAVFGTAIRTHKTHAVAAWVYLAGCLFFSWFEMYFWHLNVIEVPVAFFLIMQLSRLKLSKSPARKPDEQLKPS